MFLKKLHIKILSVALLVILIYYNGVENNTLPQQYVSEYVVYADISERFATFSKADNAQKLFTSQFTEFNFLNAFRIFNAKQNVDFKLSSFKSDILKQARRTASFFPQIVFSKDLHTSLI